MFKAWRVGLAMLVCVVLCGARCGVALAGCWETWPAIPEARSSNASVIFGDYLYVFGGWGDSCPPLSSVYRYPLDQGPSGEWEEMAEMPARWASGAIAVVGNRILIIGGDIEAVPSASVWAYTPELEGTSEDPWDTSLPAIGSPFTVAAIGASPIAAVVDGKVYVFGGRTASVVVPCIFAAWESLDTVWCFDPDAATWEAREPLPGGPSNEMGAAVIGGKVYVVGGQTNSGEFLSMVRVYDPASDTWDTSLPDVPTDILGAKAFSYRGDLIVAGGAPVAFEPATTAAWRLRTGAGIWESMPDLAVAVQTPAAAAAGDRIYLVGGSTGYGGAQSDAFQTLDLRRFRVTVPNAIVPYTLDTGSGSALVSVLVEEVGDCYPDGPGFIQGGSLGLSRDPASIEIVDVLLGAALAALNGGAGPDFVFVDLCAGGASVGFAASADADDEGITATDPQEVLLLDVHTVAEAFAGVTEGACITAAWSGNACGADPAVENVMVVGGFDETVIAEDFPICCFPLDAFLRADCNGSGGLSIADPIFALNVLFRDGTAPLCDDACDANDDGDLDISDPIYTLLALFVAGPLPPAPYVGGCGLDMTADSLSCGSAPLCD